MAKKRKILLTLISIILYFPAVCQNIRHISVGDGLPQSFISGIGEDKEGFIWVSTHNGLVRYDGLRFKVFQNIPDDTTSVFSNYITESITDRNNNLWLRYDTGEIDQFNLATYKVKHVINQDFEIRNKIQLFKRGWLVDSNGSLWVIKANGVIGNFKPVSEDWKNISANHFEVGNVSVLSIIEDSRGDILLLTGQGVMRFNSKTNNFEKFEMPFQLSFEDYSGSDLSHERPMMVEYRRNQLCWMDTEYLVFFNIQKKTYRRVKLPEKVLFNGKLISSSVAGDRLYFQINNSIYSYGSNSSITKEAELIKGINRDTQALHVDKSGLIWLGANTDGLYQIDLKAYFTTFNYKDDFAVDLFTNEWGISLYSFFGLKAGYEMLLPPSYYLRTCIDYTNDISWVALNRNVAYLEKGKVTPVSIGRVPSEVRDEFKPILGIDITPDKSIIVVDIDNNIYKYNESKGGWKKIMSGQEIEKALGFTVYPSGLVVDNDKIWITSEYNGLLCVDIKSAGIEHYTKVKGFSFPVDRLYGIVKDRKKQGVLWIASAQGLVCFNSKTHNTKLYSIKEGLPDNMVYSISMDSNGFLWLGSNKGLSRFDTKSFHVRTFTVRHGLPCYEFNRYHTFPFPDGEIAFGGVNSGVIFNPFSVNEDRYSPNIVVTGIKINNEIYEGGTFGVENTIKNLVLSHNQNTIVIEYAALEFNQPHDVKYRFRLEGYENDWTVVGKKTEAVYTKLPPGNYVFEVNSTNTSGKWSDNSKVMNIRISPPWSKTWWAVLLYVLIFLGLVLLYVRYSVKQAIIKNEVALKEKEARQLREMDQVKSRFFSNITHEIRTPLTLILGPVEQLKKSLSDHDPKYLNLLSTIGKNTNSLLNLTDQLLDVAKMEAGTLKPHMLWGDIVLAIKQIITVFEEEASLKNNEVVYEGPETREYFFAANILERILYNLLSNALKFSYEGHEIKVSFSELEEGITIDVSNLGGGIPDNEIKYIFDRFYKSEYQEKGTGIGLSLVKELVDLQGGNIEVKSEKIDKYWKTVFKVYLPYNKQVNDESVYEVPTDQNVGDNEGGLKFPTLLLVEDNKELSAFIEGNLKSHYKVYQAKNGNEGLVMAKEIMPDLILSDVLMEIMDGFEMCKYLKTNPSTDHIPIILLTAKSDEDSKLEGLSYGADDYIPKPFSISELLLRINNRLALHRKQREFFYRNLRKLSENEDLDYEIKAEVNPFIKKVCESIDDRLGDETFSIDELCESLNISRASLHRKIKSLTKMTTSEFLKVYRLRKAVLLLQQKNITISEAAYKTGFGSPSYFTRCFKEVYSVTPTEYLQKNIS